jgi:hypothetical protein
MPRRSFFVEFGGIILPPDRIRKNATGRNVMPVFPAGIYETYRPFA